MRVPSSHWAGRLALARHGRCVDGACSGWRKRLSALEYFVCLVDGLPKSLDPYDIPLLVWKYERDWSVWYSDRDEYCPYRTLRDYIWRFGKRRVSRSFAFSVPEVFPWEICHVRRDSRRHACETDCVMSHDIPF